MSIILEKQAQTFVQTQPGYSISLNPHHRRVYHIEVDKPILRAFFREFEAVNEQNLQYIPYMRFILAKKLHDLLGSSFQQILRGILHDRNSGGFTIGVQKQTENLTDYVKFGTAVSHLIGTPNFDSMTGTYYARFSVKDTDNSDSYLRQAYRIFTLHTDGTFVEEPTDWLLMMKMEEQNTVGGESRILHLDDWEELDQFANHPLGSYEFTYKSPPSKNVEQIVKRKTFFKINNKPCICFIDQFVQPETMDQSAYLHDLSQSMEDSQGTIALPLPVGDLIMLNNTFWLHGRAAFEMHPNLYRELMRQRGVFSQV